MTDYKAICSDWPKCGEENIVLLAYSFRVGSVEDPTPKRMTCKNCLHGYYQPLREMALRPKSKEEIDAIGGEAHAGLDLIWCVVRTKRKTGSISKNEEANRPGDERYRKALG